MLTGAYGRGARSRIAAAMTTTAAAAGGRRSHGAQGGLDRGDLVLAWAVEEAPTVAELDGKTCVLAGEITSARWRAGRTAPATQRISAEELLRAWERLRDGVLDGLRGSFVLVLWDDARHEGLLARDPTGLSPLFRFDASDCLLFASEIRRLLPILPQAPAPDPVALSFWLSNDACWQERTMFAGIRPVRAAHLLELADGRTRERAWWRPRYSSPPQIGLEDAAEAVATAVEQSIAMHVRAEEKVAVLLSGGVDSTSVAALAQRELRGSGNELTGYSAVFPDHPQTDERELIGELSAQLGIASVQMAVRGGSPIGGALRFMQEWRVPSLSTNCFFSQALLGRIQSDGSRMILGGEGGDELFELSSPLLADRVRAGRPLAALALAGEFPGGDRQSRRTLARLCLREAAVSTLPRSILARRHVPRGAWMGEPEWLVSELATTHRSHANPLRWRELDGPRWWAYRAHVLTAGRETIGVSDQLRRLYERDGVGIHQPLLDLDVVELVLGLPPEVAYNSNFDRPVLRTAVAGLVPERVRVGVHKSDFLPVLLDSVATNDLPLARELLLAPDARIREFVRTEIVQAQLLDGAPAHHPSGPANWTLEIWQLLSVECWLRAQEDPACIGSLLERTEPTRTSFHLELPARST